MRHTDREWLLDVLRHVGILRRYLDSGNPNRELVLDAVALRLSSAIDSVSHVPEEMRQAAISDEMWRKVKGLRNRIAHAYGFTDPAGLWETVTEDVVDFEADVRRMLERLPE